MSELYSISNGLVLDVDFRGYSSRDKSVYGNILTNFGSIWTPRGRVFDGVDDYVDAGNGASLYITSAITIEMWVLPAIGQQKSLVFKGTGTTTNYGLDTAGTSNTLRFFGYSSGTLKGITSGSPDLSVDVFSHVVGTFNGTEWKIYVNGLEKITKTQVATLSATTEILTIGSRGQALYWNGSIDEVRVWNRALTTMEINQLYLEFRKNLKI